MSHEPITSAHTPPAVLTVETEKKINAIDTANGIKNSLQNRPWYSYIWDTWDKSPEERRLIRKIDCTLVLFGMLGTFSKFIDRANLQTAYVSGMKEELSFYGNVSHFLPRWF